MKKLINTDMHIHTTASDGEFTIEEIYKKIKETKQIEIFSITNHDTIAGAKKMEKYLKQNPDEEIIYIPGVEITTNIQIPKFKIRKSKLHVLGYDFDLNNPTIRKILARRREINVRFLNAQIEGLEEMFNITFTKKELQKIFNKGHFNRVDLALAIIKQQKATTIEEAYEKYLNPAKRTIPLLPIHEEEVFDAIKQAGGYTCLAHPTSLRLDLETLKEYIIYLKSIGLDAIEVYHSQHKRKYSNKLYKIAKEQELYISGGSDYHGPVVKPQIHLGVDKGQGRPKKLTLTKKIIDNKYHHQSIK